jgi:DNA primase
LANSAVVMVTASVEQRRRLEQLHVRLADEVAALRSGEDWKRWLAAAARFHHYSFNNVLLILAQRPDATQVAGFRTWQTLGRHVDRGQKGIQILAPVYRRQRGSDNPEVDGAEDRGTFPEDAPTDQPSTPRRLVGWRVAYVWDVAQTSGEPLPEQPRPTLLSGQAPVGLWEALAGEVTGRGFVLRRGDCGAANGLTSFVDRTVTVRPDVDEAQAVKTLAHELGHVLLHDPDRFAGQLTADCRGIAEVEAESFAYLLATGAGLDTGDYTFGYVTSWAARVDVDNPQQVVTATGQRVLSAVTPVLDRLTATSNHDDAATATKPPTASRVVGSATADPEVRLAEQPGPAAATNLDRTGLVAVNRQTAAFFRDRLLDPACSGPRDYLARRGLAHLLPQSGWVLGYAPAGWTALTEHLRGRGFGDQELLAAGVAQWSRRGGLIDRFRDRLMLGLHDQRGDLVGFIGRAAPAATPETPKYLNTPATVLFDKSSVLFGLAEQRTPLAVGAVPVLVEGPLDVLAIDAAQQQAGPSRIAGPGWAAVAPCGTALTSAHADLLRDLPAGRVVVAFDADPAGTAAAARAYPLLAPHQLQLQAGTLPAGTDPADLVAHPGGAARLLEALSTTRPLSDLVVDARLLAWQDRLDNAEAKVAALRETAPAVARLRPDDVGRQATRLATILQLDPSTITRELIDAATAQLGDLDRPALRRPLPAQQPEVAPPAPAQLEPSAPSRPLSVPAMPAAARGWSA